MEHLCHRCGATVEDGVPFCRQCSAPQIRVAGFEAARSSSPSELSEASSLPQPNVPGSANQSARIQWSQALPAAALAGTVAALVMAIPGGGFGLGMVSAGAFAVLIYYRRSPHGILTAGAGARLGAVTGFIASCVLGILLSLEMAFLHSGNQLRVALLQSVEQAAARAGSDPQAQQVVQFLKSPEGLTLLLGLGVLVMLLVFLFCSMIGGAISAALLGKRERR